MNFLIISKKYFNITFQSLSLYRFTLSPFYTHLRTASRECRYRRRLARHLDSRDRCAWHAPPGDSIFRSCAPRSARYRRPWSVHSVDRATRPAADCAAIVQFRCKRARSLRIAERGTLESLLTSCVCRRACTVPDTNVWTTWQRSVPAAGNVDRPISWTWRVPDFSAWNTDAIKMLIKMIRISLRIEKMLQISFIVCKRCAPAAGRRCVCVILIKILIACVARACLCSLNVFN